MSAKTAYPASMFRKVLQAFENGDLPYTDVQLHLQRILGSGESPQELLEVLRRCESVAPLPQYAHDELLQLLNDAADQAAAQSAALDAAAAQALESESPPGQVDAAVARTPSGDMGAPTEPAASQAGHAHPADARTTHYQDDYEALTRAYERARDVGSAANARAIALAAELAEARTAADEAQRSRREEARRESERHRAEIRAAQDALAARDAAIEQGRLSLAERDARLAHLQAEHAKIAASHEERGKVAAQVAAELQMERARAAALTSELAAAHTALQAEQSKTEAIDRALADKIALSDSVRTRSDETLRESQRIEGELRKARDSLAARDKTITQARHSLAERDAEFAAQRQEHAKIVAALQARATGMEAELQAVRARVDTLTAELKASQNAASALNAQRKRGESLLAAALKKLAAVQAKANSYLELLQTREWRRGFDQNPLREMAAPEPMAPRQPKPAVQVTEFAPPTRGGARRAGPWKPGAGVRAIGIGVAVVILAVVAWHFVHRVPAAPKAAAVSAVIIPKVGSVILDCPVCPALTVLPAGRFKQGSSAAAGSASFEMPLHWVSIPRPFAMAMNAVTVDEFRAFIAATGRDMQGCDTYDGEWKIHAENNWQNPGFAQTGSHPVTCTSWDDAQAYAGWLSAKTGHRYRLPSASEWEYAARAGGEAVTPWNPDGSDACASANVADKSAAHRYPGWAAFPCDDGYVYTAPVGSFKANRWALNDMLGNVFQWTEDCWHADYAGAPVDGSARRDAVCSERELRGGSWFSTPAFVRANYRNHFDANYRTSSVGFRLARDLAP